MRQVYSDGVLGADKYTFIVMAGAAKAIITYRTGKRARANTEVFLNGLRARVVGSPEVSADGFNRYPWAVSMAFGEQCKFGVAAKHCAVNGRPEAARRSTSPVTICAAFMRPCASRPRCSSASPITCGLPPNSLKTL